GVGFAAIGTHRQITDMADTGLYDEVLAQVLVDGFCLGRGLDDYQILCHYVLIFLSFLRGHDGRTGAGRTSRNARPGKRRALNHRIPEKESGPRRGGVDQSLTGTVQPKRSSCSPRWIWQRVS